jgi:hypothetical protein
MNASLDVYSVFSEPTQVNVTISNITNYVVVPSGVHTVAAINISSDKPLARVDAKLKYPCSLPANSIAPYISSNGTWQKLNNYSVDSNVCTITVSVNRSGSLAVFSTASSQQPSSALPYAATAVVIIIVAAIALKLYASRKGLESSVHHK